MKNFLFLIGAALLLNPVGALSRTLTVCMDEDWQPYTFVKNNKIVGIHADILREAFKSLDYSLEVNPKPWKRCLHELEIGIIDATFPASYKENRSAFAYYPPNAATDKKSRFRLAQIEHVLLTKKGYPYDFDGNLSGIPQPVGVGIGGATGDTLDEMGINTLRVAASARIIALLSLERTKSAVMNSVLANDFNTHGKYAGKFKIHNLPLRSKSYFLVFSKQQEFPDNEKMHIWEAIAKVRENKQFMLEVTSRYIK
ncbi:MAG: transporter substrate-binding domain-containing protein [Gammaproteobacteria bacterium]|nr:transporter substrate-binding domain-containing protein [Gammaproteobacteria bacterium]